MLLVLFQPFLDQAGLHAMAPARRFRQIGIAATPFQDLGRQAQPPGQLGPEEGELAGFIHHDVVAGRKHIGQGRFPGAGARGGIDDHRMLGLEDAPDGLRHLQAQRGELRAAMVDGGQAHGAQDAIGHPTGARNLQEMMSSGMEVERQHGRPASCVFLGQNARVPAAEMQMAKVNRGSARL